ncbi:MAG TPA: glycosyltransferase [Gemmatimonadota bacterium]|nr:glycosyltransferase [Gemmatimonadota bacterium]
MIPSPRTVLHVDSAREYRGGQNQARLLMAGLTGRGDIRQALVARAESRLAREAADLGVRVYPTPWRGAVDHSALLELSSRLRDGWDVVHAHDGHAVQSVLMARALIGSVSPVVAARRVDFPVRRMFVWQRADLVLAVSRRIREVLVGQGIDRRRVEVVYSGIDPHDVVPPPGHDAARELRAAGSVGDEQVLVAAVGALVGHKDHATFVRAAALLAPRYPEARFAVFGEGPERPKLERLVREHGLDRVFSLPGRFADAAQALDGIDIFVMPSKEEGLGTACIEAMHAARPVVATSAGGLGELAVDGAFRPVVPADPAALAVELEPLLADRSARERAGEAARRGAVRFTAAAMVVATLRAYRAVTASAA